MCEDTEWFRSWRLSFGESGLGSFLASRTSAVREIGRYCGVAIDLDAICSYGSNGKGSNVASGAMESKKNESYTLEWNHVESKLIVFCYHYEN